MKTLALNFIITPCDIDDDELFEKHSTALVETLHDVIAEYYPASEVTVDIVGFDQDLETSLEVKH